MKKTLLPFIIVLLLLTCPGCEKEPSVFRIALKADKETLIADGEEKITFTVVTNGGEDVTSLSFIKVNGQKIEGNTFSSTVIGSYICIAEYKSTQSSGFNFEVKEIPVFRKNILIESYTSTDCGYCPRIHDAVDAVLALDDRIIPVALHCGNTDPFFFSSTSILASSFLVPGFPTGVIDRDYFWPYPEYSDGLKAALNTNAALGLALASEVSEDNILTTVKVRFGKTFTGRLKLVVCMTENQLVANQANYYADGRGDPIVGYIHNHVLRKFGTDILGDEIPVESTVKDAEYTRSFTLNASGYVKENCRVVAFVVNPDRKVLNVRKVEAPGSNDYQELD